MFCSKCGKEIANDAAFCPACGNAVNAPAASSAAPVATAPAEPSAFSVACGKFLGILKGVFSADATKTLATQAKNTGLEWIFGLSLAIVTFVLYRVIAVAHAASYFSGGAFFQHFAKNLFLSIFVLGAVLFGMWVMTKLVTRKDIPWLCILNVLGTATLPLSACCLLNMLLCLLWAPLAAFVSIIGQVMSLLLLYTGFEKLEKPAISPLYPFTLVTVFALLVEQLMRYILF